MVLHFRSVVTLLLILSSVSSALNPAAATYSLGSDRNGTWTLVFGNAGSLYSRSMKQLARCDESL